jgi:hypothetical protein
LPFKYLQIKTPNRTREGAGGLVFIVIYAESILTSPKTRDLGPRPLLLFYPPVFLVDNALPLHIVRVTAVASVLFP